MTLEESREVIPMMETMINQIEEQQNLMAEMVQELQERDMIILISKLLGIFPVSCGIIACLGNHPGSM